MDEKKLGKAAAEKSEESRREENKEAFTIPDEASCSPEFSGGCVFRDN